MLAFAEAQTCRLLRTIQYIHELHFEITILMISSCNASRTSCRGDRETRSGIDLAGDDLADYEMMNECQVLILI